MKCLFLHVDNFRCEIIHNDKSRKMGLPEDGEKNYTNLNCLVNYICFEQEDKYLDLNFLTDEILKVCAITKVQKLIMFPFAHLSNKLLDLENAKFLAGILSLKIDQKVERHSGKLELMQIPFGYDKKFAIETKGHSFNVIFREYNCKVQDVYDKAILSHPEYTEMTDKMLELISGTVLEVGSGTGLFTKQILKKGVGLLFCIEPDKEFYAKFKENNPRVDIEKISGENYHQPESFDTITMSLVLHHIKDEKKKNFLLNLKKNLKSGGKIIIGDVFLPPYKNKIGWKESLKKYHENRLKLIKEDETFVKYIELEAWEDGKNKSSEFKICISEALHLLKETGYSQIDVIPVGSQDFGGYNIITATK